MATSGVVTFNITRNEIITDALRLCQAHGVGQTLTAEMVSDGTRRLNVMIKFWQTQGLHLWRKTEAALFLTADQQSYTLSATGDRATTSYDETTLDGAHIATATTIEVASTSGMTASDLVGIELADGTMQWTTIAGVTDSDTFTIPGPGLTGAAADGGKVYSFTTKIARPLRILNARRVADGSETELMPLSRQEYFALPQKASTGAPTQYFYDPQLNFGKLYLWPTSDNAVDLVKFTYERPIEDFVSTADNPDFPVEWVEALIYGLAVRLYPEYGNDPQRYGMLKAEADEKLALVMAFDSEQESIFFQPGRQ